MFIYVELEGIDINIDIIRNSYKQPAQKMGLSPNLPVKSEVNYFGVPYIDIKDGKAAIVSQDRGVVRTGKYTDDVEKITKALINLAK